MDILNSSYFYIFALDLQETKIERTLNTLTN